MDLTENPFVCRESRLLDASSDSAAAPVALAVQAVSDQPTIRIAHELKCALRIWWGHDVHLMSSPSRVQEGVRYNFEFLEQVSCMERIDDRVVDFDWVRSRITALAIALVHDAMTQDVQSMHRYPKLGYIDKHLDQVTLPTGRFPMEPIPPRFSRN